MVDILKESLYRAETEEVFLVLLTIDHEALPFPIRLCNDNQDTISRGNTFIAFRFEIQLPSSEADSPPRARIRVDNVDKRIVDAVRSVTSAPTVVMEIIRAATPDIIEVSLPGFQLTNVAYNALVVTGDLGLENLLLEPYPGAIFDPGRFPGLF